MNRQLHSSALVVVVAIAAARARAQSYVSSPAHIPVNTGYSENVDFADVDLDGDSDAALAQGGDWGNQQSRLWINRGFEPGGTIGFFDDRTAAQFPAVPRDSRDVDFGDLDGDGDADLLLSNTSTVSIQTNSWWINMGGAQGGTAGFFQDQTQARWTFVGVNDGVNHFSSVSVNQVLPSGGFVDWSCDAVLGDLDADSDLDVFHSSYGPVFSGNVPARIFLNDGSGHFEEFNPSHFQLTGGAIQNGDPALWCQGVQQHDTTDTTGAQADIASNTLGIELGDVDADFDVDVLQGSRAATPRMFRNRATDTGAFTAFRDVTFASGYPPSVSGNNNYEQEMGDFDSDQDIDILGVNWPGFNDATLRNDGAGVFGSSFVFANSGADDNDADFVDYDNDGHLDVFFEAFAGQDRLYRNPGPPTWQHANVTASEMPVVNLRTLGGDSCDVDLDGDYDLLTAEDSGFAEVFFENVNQIADTSAPRPSPLEQAPDRAASAVPTFVRAHVYDNTSWDVARYDVVELEHRVNGGAWTAAPMRYSGGQVFRGAIPGTLVGTIEYRVHAVDEHGNSAFSSVKSFLSSGCGLVQPYCTSGTTTNGCAASMAGVGTPSASASSGFVISASNVEGQKSGILFYGLSGGVQTSWAPGSTSFLCVKLPVQRMGLQSSGGTPGGCNGQFSIDWNNYMATHPGALGSPIGVGQDVRAQAWFRDPPAPKATSLSNGLQFTTCP